MAGGLEKNNLKLRVCQLWRGNISFTIGRKRLAKSNRTEDTFFSPTDVTADTALSLDGTGRLDYSLKQGPKRDVLLRRALQGAAADPAIPSSLEVKFRTRAKSGTLLHVQENSNYTTVKVRQRRRDGEVRLVSHWCRSRG